MIKSTLPIWNLLLRKSIFCLALFISIQVFAQPTITSFTPKSGTVGSTVTISGTNFSSIPENNIVYFGVVRASVFTATTTSLTVTVPVGATYQPINVTVNNLIAYSNDPFIVTFSGASPQFTAQSFEYVTHIDSVSSDIETTKYVLGDIDGDNKIDVITVDRLNNTMSVYRNTTTGLISFAAKVDFTTGQSPRAASVGDIDGDGKLDVIVSNLTDNTVSVFKNTTIGGVISFAQRIDFITSTQPSGISIADLDKDGKADLVINTINLEGYVSILRNTSSGSIISFAPKIDLQAQGGSIEEIRTSDIDGDGKQDIILPNYSLNVLNIFRNTSSVGIISFATKIDIGTFTNPDDIEMGDLNDDGKPDIAVGHYTNDKVLVLRNVSTVGTITFQSNGSYTGGIIPSGMAINNLDGDSKPDLVVNDGLESFSLYKNTSSSGNAISFNPGVKIPAVYNSKVMSADFDGDGKTDLTFETGILRVTIWKNRTASPQVFSFSPASGRQGDTITIQGVNFSGATSVSFGSVTASSFTLLNASTIKAVVDTGATGDIIVRTAGDSARIHGFIFFAPPKITSFSPNTGTLGSVVTITGNNFIGTTSVTFGGTAADAFTVQSKTTITATVLGGSSGYIKVTTSQGSDSLPGFTYIPVTPPGISSFSPAQGTVGTIVVISGNNFNPDTALNYVYFGPAKAKVITASVNSLSVQVPPGAAYGEISVTANSLTAYSPYLFIPVFPSGGNISSGSFSEFVTFETGGSPEDVCIGDFDLDGKNDLAVVQAQRSGITLLHSNTNSDNISFDTKLDITGFSPYGLIESVDIDGDGKKDLVAAGSYSNTLSVFKNTSSTGTINFSERKDYYLANFNTNVAALAIGDIDSDGKPDILITGYNNVSIIRNTSFPNRIYLEPMISINVGQVNKAVKIGDIDGDGKRDIVLLSGPNDSVLILRNTSSGGVLSFEEPVSFATKDDETSIYGSTDICLSDLNNDGKTDIIVANNVSSQSISVLKNNSIPGNILSPSRTDIMTGDTQPFTLAAEDLDGDGKPDLTFNNGNAWRAVSTIKNNSITNTFNFALPNTFPFGSNGGPAGICTGDLNNDGRPEIICAAGLFSSPGYIYVFKNKTNGPHITSFNPRNGIKDSVITITGSNFTGTTSVTFGGSPAQSFSVISSTTITAVVGSGGSGNIDITTPLGTSSIPGFLYGLAPIITSFNPASAGTNKPINIVGKNFTWANNVKFGGVSAVSVTINSDTSITAVVGIGASGAVNVIGNVDSASMPGFTYIPPPVIDSFSPQYGTTGTTVSIYGSNFNGAINVYFGFAPAQSFTVVNSSSIQAVVGAGASGEVIVETPGGAFYKNYFQFYSPPILTSFSPANAGQGMAITITGNNLNGTSAVSFGGVAAASFTINSATSITAILAAGASGNISVTTPGGTTTLPGFSFIPAPTIASFTPTTAGTGATITITGTNLTGATAVSFGGVAASLFTVNSSTSITAAVATGASGTVSVTTPGGIATLSGFSFILAPTITSFTPTTAGTGTTVTITGTNFTGATTVSFGGVPASSFNINSATSITSIVNTGATGNVSITTSGGTSTLSGFTFIPAPTITSFTPATAGTGTTVTIIGTNFTGATTVSLGGVAASSFTVVNSTTISAIVGTGASGSVSITTPGGTASLAGFVYNSVTGIVSPGNVNSTELTVYPNPSNTSIVIKYPASIKKTTLRFIDLLGREVKILYPSRNSDRTDIKVDDWVTGIYTIVWSDGARFLSRVFIVQ